MATAQDGDGDAYRQLLREIAPFLRRVAARRLYSASAADIEDVVQDVLLSVHRVRQTYDPARPFLPWLMAIQHHRLIDWMRRSVTRSANELAVESLEVAFAEHAANNDNDEAIKAIERKDIHSAVAKLPPAQRQAIELLKLKQMSLKEAAQQTGLTETALKVATHRGIKALRALLGKDR